MCHARWKEKVRCDRINQKNTQIKNPFNEGKILPELNYEIFYLNSIDHSLHEHEHNFIMPDILTIINLKTTNQQKLDTIPMFAIHSRILERVIFNEFWGGRRLYQFPGSIPLHSAY